MAIRVFDDITSLFDEGMLIKVVPFELEDIMRITVMESLTRPSEVILCAESRYGETFYIDMDSKVFNDTFLRSDYITKFSNDIKSLDGITDNTDADDKKLDKLYPKMVQLKVPINIRKLRFD